MTSNKPAILSCQLNHMVNPVGYKMDHTTFSFTTNFAVKESRIVVTNQDTGSVIYDTGFNENIDPLGTILPLSLAPRTPYNWKVTACTSDNIKVESDLQYFETGRTGEQFTGKWITDGTKKEQNPVFVKHIDPNPHKTLKRARMYICGLGIYEAYINGCRVGDEYLTPYLNNYDCFVQYQTYDITESLKKGGKGGDVEIALFHGWYEKGGFGFGDVRTGEVQLYGNEKKLICDIILTYTDGSEEITGTDETWLQKRGCIAFSNIYDGEKRDDTLPTDTEGNAVIALPPRCEKPVLQQVSPEISALIPRLSTPVKIRKEMPVKQVITDKNGDTVLDLQQEITGIFRLHVREEKGSVIHLQFGEILQNGCFYNDNLRSAKAEYFYTSDGVEKDIIPKSTFYGYRYVKIEGAKHFSKDDFTGLVLCSEIPQISTITTGNSKINRLIDNARWGQICNFVDVPTDCPQRDERMGWTGDAQVFTATALTFRDCYAFYKKYLYDMKTEQARLGGICPDVVPYTSKGNMYQSDLKSCSAAWGDAACVIPWTVYQYYGDKTILLECFDQMRAWVDAVSEMENDNHAWRDQFHYGDWLALDGIGAGDSAFGATDPGFIAETYFYYSSSLVAKAAAVLGYDEEAAKYQQLCDNIKKYIQQEYFTATGRLAVPTQTGCLLMLHHHLTPDHDRTIAQLKDLFRQSNGQLRTGFVGMPIMMQTLTEEGMFDTAKQLLLNEEYPGWLYEVNMGATTIWERWNSVSPDGSISSTGMNSLNHYSYGSVCAWIYQDVLGVRIAEPGYRKVEINPHPIKELGFIEGNIRTPAGELSVKWQYQGEKAVLTLSIPEGMDAELIQSNGRIVLQPGEQSFTLG